MGQKPKGLKNKARPLIAVGRQGSVAAPQGCTVNLHFPCIRTGEPADNVCQRCFARTRWSDNGQQLAFFNIEADITNSMDFTAAQPKSFRHPNKAYAVTGRTHRTILLHARRPLPRKTLTF